MLYCPRMEMLASLSHVGFLYAIAGLFTLCNALLLLWVVKAKYFYADKLFLRLDKELRKHGMWTLLMMMTSVVMTAFVIHGAIVLLALVAGRA
jgi:hypothetical protein